MLKKTLACLLTACLLISLTACGGGSTSSATDTPASSGGEAPTTAGDGNDTPSGAAKESIVSAAAAEPRLFFMYNTTGATTNMDEVPVLNNIYDAVLKMNPDNSLSPHLAESWEVSEDGLHYTLNIRQGVTFHNGDPLTAEDIAYTFNYGSKTPGATSLMFAVDEAEIVDDYTVIVHLSEPFGGFPNALASRYALVINKKHHEAVGDEGYSDDPVGTGPYTIAARSPGDSVTLQAYPDYWKGEAPIKTIYHKVISDPNAQIMALENGEIDVLINTNISPLLMLPDNSVVKYEVQTAATVTPMLFNQGINAGISADENFRKAVQHAVDKEQVNIGTYEGFAKPADIAIVPGFTDRPAEGTYTVVEKDVDKAKEYLAAANYNGEEFSIVVTSGTKAETAAQIVQGQLIEIGINCTVNAVDSVSYMAITRQSGDFGASMRSNSSSTLDSDMLYFLHYSEYLQKEVYDNGNHTPELDVLLRNGRVESNSAARQELYRQAVEIITDQAICVPILYDMNVVAYNENMNGVEPGALVGLYYMHDWS